MSSIVSSLVAGKKQRSSSRRRSSNSSSESRYSSSRSDTGESNNSKTDVSTMICAELAGCLVSNPDVNTGTFYVTSDNSKHDICRSDTTRIVTAAILEHIGNPRSAMKLLKGSNTCSKYYKELGLEDRRVREMFVTMMFCINPEMVRLVQMAMQVALDRAAEKTDTSITEPRVIMAAAALKDKSKISYDELVKMTALGNNASNKVDIDSFVHRLTTDNKIAPDDSISKVGSPVTTSPTLAMNEKDMMEYIKRRKTGREPSFADVFNSAPEPIKVKPKHDKNGLGFKEDYSSIRSQMMDDILGKLRNIDLDSNMNAVRGRRPTVSDFLASGEVASTVFRSAPDSDEISYTATDKMDMTRPCDTDIGLPDSVIVEELPIDTRLNRKTSYELLMETINKLN